jgi:hypothetical protein
MDGFGVYQYLRITSGLPRHPGAIRRGDTASCIPDADSRAKYALLLPGTLVP